MRDETRRDETTQGQVKRKGSTLSLSPRLCCECYEFKHLDDRRDRHARLKLSRCSLTVVENVLSDPKSIALAKSAGQLQTLLYTEAVLGWSESVELPSGGLPGKARRLESRLHRNIRRTMKGYRVRLEMKSHQKFIKRHHDR